MDVSLQAVEAVARELQIEASPAEIGLTPPAGYEVKFDSPVGLTVSVRRVGEEFFLDGAASTQGTYVCVRCLREYTEPLEVPVNLVVHRVAELKEQTSELDLYAEVPIGTAEFDLGPYVREALLLAVPANPHCQPDCKGLCGQCGADLNSEPCRCEGREPDPRWDGLKELKTKR